MYTCTCSNECTDTYSVGPKCGCSYEFSYMNFYNTYQVNDMVVLTECTDSVSVFLQLYCLTIDVTGSMDVLVNALTVYLF